MARKKKALLGALGLTATEHVQEALYFTKEVERLAKVYGDGKACPRPATMLDIGDTIGFTRANLRYSTPEANRDMPDTQKVLHKTVQRRYLDAVVKLSRAIDQNCAAVGLKGVAGLRRKSRRK